ncbi:unnamed protein product [Ambrosiozyma monospora]|uniref:Unnamed protein product n=1 Tax=Ambrosiozyma monospora TaxID=43982 RepID=A0ACB5TYG9_AMBMO|nr:unnamed protein product [Ambrosiozyma monospora]
MDMDSIPDHVEHVTSEIHGLISYKPFKLPSYLKIFKIICPIHLLPIVEITNAEDPTHLRELSIETGIDERFQNKNNNHAKIILRLFIGVFPSSCDSLVLSNFSQWKPVSFHNLDKK